MKDLKFEWDRGNSYKSLFKHGITNEESESIFKDENRSVFFDLKHSSEFEDRYICIGKGLSGVILFSCFTLRAGRIRIIGARKANKKEVADYESNKK